jgi:hypothetical protein
MLKKILSIKPIDVRLIWRLESVLGQADIDLDNKSLTATLRPLIALFKTASKEQTDKIVEYIQENIIDKGATNHINESLIQLTVDALINANKVETAMSFAETNAETNNGNRGFARLAEHFEQKGNYVTMYRMIDKITNQPKKNLIIEEIIARLSLLSNKEEQIAALREKKT